MSFQFKDIEDFKDCVRERYLDMIVHDMVSDSYFRMRKPKESVDSISLFKIGASFKNKADFLYNRYKNGTVTFITSGEMLLGLGSKKKY